MARSPGRSRRRRAPAPAVTLNATTESLPGAQQLSAGASSSAERSCTPPSSPMERGACRPPPQALLPTSLRPPPHRSPRAAHLVSAAPYTHGPAARAVGSRKKYREPTEVSAHRAIEPAFRLPPAAWAFLARPAARPEQTNSPRPTPPAQGPQRGEHHVRQAGGPRHTYAQILPATAQAEQLEMERQAQRTHNTTKKIKSGQAVDAGGGGRRKHIDVQTGQYLEELTDRPVESTLTRRRAARCCLRAAARPRPAAPPR